MRTKTVPSLFLLLPLLLLSAPLPPLFAAEPQGLFRIARRGNGDLSTLLKSRVGVVMEAASCLLAEMEGGRAAELTTGGWELELLDSSPRLSTYCQVSLRPDSDLAQLLACGEVLHTDDGWLLLRLHPDRDILSLSAARAFVTPLSHEPLQLPRDLPIREPRETARTGRATPDPLIQKMVASVDASEVEATWASLVPPNPPGNGSRYTENAGCFAAAQTAQTFLEAQGCAVQSVSYIANYAPNSIGTMLGALTPERVYIVEGHLDDMPNAGYAPGADDNASGVVTLLEAARALSCYAYKSTVKFLAVTGEETGLNGSRAYANDAFARGEDIRGVVNMDMVGWAGNNLPPGEDLDVNYNTASQELGLFFAQCAGDYGTGLAVSAFSCASMTASDHYPFWQKGYKAICGITDNEGSCGHAGHYPYYHTSSDTIANCGDQSFLLKVVKASVATLAELAEPFRITFHKATYTCSETAEIVVGDPDLNSNPAGVETVSVEVWSEAETTPEWALLTEISPDSALFRGAIPLSLQLPLHGDGQLAVSPGGTLSARYTDAVDCDGALGVIYTTTADLHATCGPLLSYDSHGDFSQVEGDGDSAVEAGERWRVPVTLKNTGVLGATGASARLSAEGAQACGGPADFGAIPIGGTATALFDFVVPAETACAASLHFGVASKRCAERDPAGADEAARFSISVGHATYPPQQTLLLTPSSQDAEVSEASPDTPAGSGTTLQVRSQAGGARRALLSFDLSPLPAGASVTSASLELYATSAPGTGQSLVAAPLTAAWAEGTATWNTQPAASVPESTISAGTAAGWKVWPVTAPVQGWATGASENWGFSIRCASEDARFAQSYLFASRENSSGSLRPLLRIQYTPAPQWDCPYVGTSQCLPGAPGETAPGNSWASAQVWNADKATHTWPANGQATGYKVLRGTPEQLPELLTGNTDHCLRWMGTATNCGLGETPTAGNFYWYLVLGTNEGGDGSPGSATAGFRTVQSTGTCP